MKKRAAYLFLAIYLLGATELNQLLKMPLLIEHYMEHKLDNGSLSLLSFMYMHYVGDDGDATDEQKDQNLTWRAEDYCANLKKASQRLETMTGRPSLPLFRAPGGKTSPALLKAASQCGFTHVAWSPAGFLGDELSSEKFSNQHLLDKALKSLRPGDVAMAHLGIWSRKDPWAPVVLEPLIVGLKKKGYCFDTILGIQQHRQISRIMKP